MFKQENNELENEDIELLLERGIEKTDYFNKELNNKMKDIEQNNSLGLTKINLYSIFENADDE